MKNGKTKKQKGQEIPAFEPVKKEQVLRLIKQARKGKYDKRLLPIIIERYNHTNPDNRIEVKLNGRFRNFDKRRDA